MKKLISDLEIIEKPYETNPKDIMYPYVYCDTVNEIIKLLSEGNFILRDFNWTDWQAEAGKYYSGKLPVENASTELCCQLVTTYIRKERFCSGILAGTLENGHFIKVLRQLIKSVESEVK